MTSLDMTRNERSGRHTVTGTAAAASSLSTKYNIPSSPRPSPLRALAYDALSRRDGFAGWKRHRDRFRASCRLEPQVLCERSWQRVAAIVAHAHQSSAYYRDAFDQAGVRPSARLTPEDFVRLPFLTKDIIRERKASIVSNRFGQSDLEMSLTGGTTGAQTAFFLDRACKVTRVGRQWGILERCGYSPGMRRGLVWGVHSDLPPEGLMGFKAWFRRYASADETLCCTVMDRDGTLAYHERLVRFRPELLYGYPSALLELARIVEEEGMQPVQVGRVLTTAERLTPSMRERLQQAFGGEVFNLYCTREYGCIAFECGEHRGLHIDSESLWVEIVRDGRQAAPGEVGEIVITDLNNYGMPFIRSRTGDIGALSAAPCPCGLPFPLLMGLDGRDSDVVYRPDGRVVPGLMLTDLLADFPGVRVAQFIQERPDALEVRLVVNDDFPEHGTAGVEREIRTLMGGDIALTFRFVEQIERNPISGKLREVISRVRTSVATSRS